MNTNSRNVTYSTVGDYQLPNLTLNQPRKPLGKYGRLRRTYLKEHRPVLYHTMLLNGSLYAPDGASYEYYTDDGETKDYDKPEHFVHITLDVDGNAKSNRATVKVEG